jgi:hypothetical protein
MYFSKIISIFIAASAISTAKDSPPIPQDVGDVVFKVTSEHPHQSIDGDDS